MAINVNTVYQTVLLILNKEQRGYLTPAEFNKIASQVQLEIFEKYFEDLNQQLRGPGFQDEYADRVDNIEEKISIFKTINVGVYSNNYFLIPQDLHRLGGVIYKNEQEVQMTDRSEYLRLNMSNLTKPSLKYPLYIQEGDKIYVFPEKIKTDISFSYIRKPNPVVWAYREGQQGQYIWDGAPTGSGPTIPATGSVNFEISEQDQVEAVLRVLMYAGVVIRDPQIVQAASAEAAKNEQNQKT